MKTRTNKFSSSGQKKKDYSEFVSELCDFILKKPTFKK
jgi:hypothetical protein